MTHTQKSFWLVIPCLLLLSFGGCSREDLDKWQSCKFLKKAIKEGQRPEMEKQRIVESFQKKKPVFVELRDRMLQNPKVTQISRLKPPGVNRVNYTNIGQGLFDYRGVEKKFGIKEEWLKEMFGKMDGIGCVFLQKSYVYEDSDPSIYQGKKHEVLEFVLESGGFFGPDWTKGIAYYPYGYMPKTREDGYGGQWIFYKYFNKVEGDWYVYSRK